MSQSPVTASAQEDMFAYDNAWSALNQMIREGTPFSGGEKNCAFLNLGPAGTKFANISAASGFDFDDDGRGLTTVDWDLDGDLDILTTNRTAPRVRYLRNDAPHPGGPPRWVAIRLQGTKANRDAIGARLEVHLSNGAKRIKTLHAGHSHLSQAPKWLHVGLGDQPNVSHVIVRWPGSGTSRYAGIEPGQRYRLVEGEDAPQPWSAPATGAALSPAVAVGKPESDAGRIVLLRPPAMPSLEANDLDGNPIELDRTGKPLLVNLWATWCAPCLAEMKEWGEHQQEFAAAGLQVVSLSVDEPTGDPAADVKNIRRFADKLDYPYTVGLPSDQLPDILDTVQLALIGRQTPLPVPSSFLITPDRRLAAIYRGPVSADQVLRDIGLIGAPADAILASAIPFPGTWIDSPDPTGAKHIAATFTRKGRLQQAADYALDVIGRTAAQPDLLDEDEDSTLLRVRAAALYDLKQYEPSIETWREYLTRSPGNRAALLELSRCYTALNDLAKATEYLEKVLELNRDDAVNLTRLANFKTRLGEPAAALELYDEAAALRPLNAPQQFARSGLLVATGRVADAIAALEAALDERPGWPPAANNLAWILATAPQDDLRDPTEALRLAKLAATAGAGKVPSALGTLAAGYAANGDFENAVATAEQAVAAAKERFPDAPERVAPFLTPLENYRNNRPYRDPALAPKS